MSQNPQPHHAGIEIESTKTAMKVNSLKNVDYVYLGDGSLVTFNFHKWSQILILRPTLNFHEPITLFSSFSNLEDQLQ